MLGHLQVVTDALGERVTYQHDAQGRLLQSQLPDGRVEQYLNESVLTASKKGWLANKIPKSKRGRCP
ncbi:RHS repeat protein [Pseudomonas gingeri]|uniref:RHS repeat protein n=1 Tax=Pseudomonas gingeri TaxID=117681 RepID=A0A7Y7XAM6_9PSED|nr:RHS repeat protein [Pseudomonas gingeri]